MKRHILAPIWTGYSVMRIDFLKPGWTRGRRVRVAQVSVPQLFAFLILAVWCGGPAFGDKVSPPVSGSLNGDAGYRALANTSNSARLQAIQALEPQIKWGLTGAEFALYLGDTKGSWRAQMINVLAGHARTGLEGHEVAAILGDTDGKARVDAITYIEPKVMYGLDIDGLLEILGKSKGSWRAQMIGVIADHAGNRKPKPEDTNTASNAAENGVVAGDQDMTLDDGQTSADLTQKFPLLSQKDPAAYKANSPLLTARDTTDNPNNPGQTAPVTYLACAATVYTMIERGLGRANATIDDVYVIGPGAVPSRLKTVAVGSMESIDYQKIRASLAAGVPVVLKGTGGPLGSHYALLVAIEMKDGKAVAVTIYDPWPGKDKASPGRRVPLAVTSTTIAYAQIGVTFSQMRLASKKSW